MVFKPKMEPGWFFIQRKAFYTEVCLPPPDKERGGWVTVQVPTSRIPESCEFLGVTDSVCFYFLCSLGRTGEGSGCRKLHSSQGWVFLALQKAASINHSKYHCLGPSDNKAFYNILASYTPNTPVLHGSKALRKAGILQSTSVINTNKRHIFDSS